MTKYRVIGVIGAASCAILASPTLDRTVVWAQTSDLDRLLQRVVSKADDNWTRLRQYVLDEHGTLRVTGPSNTPIYGFTRDYTWFITDGIFVRSPLRADGVTIGESERVEYEASWMKRERRRMAEEQAHDADADTDTAPDAGETVEQDAETTIGAVLDQSLQPRFVSVAYFLEFEFDVGQYAPVGREALDGHEVLRVEYYPTKLFNEGRTRPDAASVIATTTYVRSSTRPPWSHCGSTR